MVDDAAKRVLVDSNVLIDVLGDDPHWADWSTNKLEKLGRDHELFINPIVYAEVSIAFERIEQWESCLAETGLGVEQMPREALFLAGKAFVSYRRKNKAAKKSTLPDFFIGAHAAVTRSILLTRDEGRYRTYFPTVELVTPQPC